MNNPRFAIQLMVAQGILFAAETAIIHQIGPHVPVMQLALVRGIGGLLLVFIVARKIETPVLRTRQLPLQLLRGSVSLIYLWVMIYSFQLLTFGDATAISYTQAAYIGLFSMLILGETVSSTRWIAAGLGIFGALLIAKPTFGAWTNAYLIALLGTSLNGLSFVLNRYLQRDDSGATTMFYTNLILVIGNAPAAATIGVPSLDVGVSLAGLLVLGPLGMYAGIAAVKNASAATLGPFTLLRLIIGISGGVVLFRELPDAASSLGAALILSGCLLSLHSRSATSRRWGWRRRSPI